MPKSHERQLTDNHKIELETTLQEFLLLLLLKRVDADVLARLHLLHFLRRRHNNNFSLTEFPMERRRLQRSQSERIRTALRRGKDVRLKHQLLHQLHARHLEVMRNRTGTGGAGPDSVYRNPGQSDENSSTDAELEQLLKSLEDSVSDMDTRQAQAPGGPSIEDEVEEYLEYDLLTTCPFCQLPLTLTNSSFHCQCQFGLQLPSGISVFDTLRALLPHVKQHRCRLEPSSSAQDWLIIAHEQVGVWLMCQHCHHDALII